MRHDPGTNMTRRLAALAVGLIALVCFAPALAQAAGDNDLAVHVPAGKTVAATIPAGAVVTYAAATVTDEETPLPSVSCNHASGSTFPIGTTTVTCTASDPDDSNSPASASFAITVKGPTVASKSYSTAEN